MFGTPIFALYATVPPDSNGKTDMYRHVTCVKLNATKAGDMMALNSQREGFNSTMTGIKTTRKTYTEHQNRYEIIH